LADPNHPPRQYLTPFDKAISVVTAVVLHAEFAVTLYAVRASAAGGARFLLFSRKQRPRQGIRTLTTCNAPPPLPHKQTQRTQMVRMLRMQRRQYYLFEAALQQQQDKQQWRAQEQQRQWIQRPSGGF
jgi:hypothetical protein